MNYIAMLTQNGKKMGSPGKPSAEQVRHLIKASELEKSPVPVSADGSVVVTMSPNSAMLLLFLIMVTASYFIFTPKLHKAGEIFVQVVSLYMLGGKWRRFMETT